MLRRSLYAALRRADDPRAVNVDMAVYGATPGGIVAAISARRRGLSTAIIGGWREVVAGGMMAGGLGLTDLRNHAAVGGISREVFDRLDALYGRERDASFNFEPSKAKLVFAQMLAEEGVPVYWTRGISAARKDGARLKGFGTRDGLMCSAQVFVDASYEGDLIAFAGVPYRTGREPQYLHGEPANGVNFSDWHHNFRYSGVEIIVDPYVTPGDAGSGVLPGVYPSTGVVGAGDGASQAFNFRVTMTTNSLIRRPFPTEAPRNYDPARYEVLARWVEGIVAAGFTPSFHDFVIAGGLPNNKRDINAAGAFSTDNFGANWQYVEAGFDYASNRSIDYALRETIWQAHIDHHMGFFWWFRDPENARCPGYLREQMSAQWLPVDEYNEFHPNDFAGWPTQWYVREGRRMVSEVVLTQADVQRPDSGVPLLPEATVALGSYEMDSHHCNRVMLEYAPGQWRLWNEGGVYAFAGGGNRLTPIPYQCLRPREADCDNLLTPWGISATHMGFSVARMEPTSMQMGHVCGVAAAMAVAGPNQVAVQAIDVDVLRATLRREGVAVDAV